MTSARWRSSDIRQFLIQAINILKDYEVASKQRISYAVDFNVLDFCLEPTSTIHRKVATLFEGDSETGTNDRYAEGIASLVRKGPRSDVDNVDDHLHIFPKHDIEFSRWRIRGFEQIATYWRNIQAERTTLGQITQEYKNALLGDVMPREVAEQLLTRVRSEVPHVVAVLDGTLSGYQRIATELEKQLVKVIVNWRLISDGLRREVNCIGETADLYFQDTERKTPGMALTDAMTLAEVIALNSLHMQRMDGSRMILLTFDRELLGLANVLKVCKERVGGYPLEELALVRDARMIPFLPGFEWGTRGTLQSEEFLQHVVGLAFNDRGFRDIELDAAFVDRATPQLRRNSKNWGARSALLAKRLGVVFPDEERATAEVDIARSLNDVGEKIVQGTELAMFRGVLGRQEQLDSTDVLSLLRSGSFERMIEDKVRATFHELFSTAWGAQGRRSQLFHGVEELLAKRIFGGVESGQMPVVLVSSQIGDMGRLFSTLGRISEGDKAAHYQLGQYVSVPALAIDTAKAYVDGLRGDWRVALGGATPR